MPCPARDVTKDRPQKKAHQQRFLWGFSEDLMGRIVGYSCDLSNQLWWPNRHTWNCSPTAAFDQTFEEFFTIQNFPYIEEMSDAL